MKAYNNTKWGIELTTKHNGLNRYHCLYSSTRTNFKHVEQKAIEMHRRQPGAVLSVYFNDGYLAGESLVIIPEKPDFSLRPYNF